MPRVSANRVVYAIGDSQAGTGGYRPGPAAPLFHLRPMLGDRAVVKAQGVGGETTEQTLARLGRDVIDRSPRPDACIVVAGTNDLQADVPTAATIANLETIYGRLLDKDVRVVALTVYPFGNHYMWTPAREAARRHVLEWMRVRVPLSLPEVEVVDVEDVVADRSETGRPVIRPEYDDGTGLHLNEAGAMAVARVLSECGAC